MNLHTRLLRQEDMARAQDLFYCAFADGKELSSVLRSPAGVGIIVGLGLILDFVVVSRAVTKGTTSCAAIALHFLVTSVGGGVGVVILCCYRNLVAWMFVQRSLISFNNSLSAHCDGDTLEQQSSHGSSSLCWVIELVPDNTTTDQPDGIIIGLIVVRTSSVKHNRRWLRERNLESNGASSGKTCDFNSGLAHVDWLMVRKGYRRQGVASTLLRVAEEHCRNSTDERGIPKYRYMRLGVGSSWAGAVLFYRRLCYSEESCSSSSLFSERLIYLRKPLHNHE
eukprot:TRINITY_DN24055_c0_g1_i1.p1 TRINITY_DN24055_c0_g1~~TRINITY_DN24055_c0_g1_i1.p1  ORF type:complete len:281 (-),score=32.31 TRINITY_DN24055_c0_g1_i1:56-898(-)